MMELINRARANPGAEADRLGIGLNDGLDDGTIEDTPKPPLAFHPLLINAARDHTRWMLDNGTFSHTGEGGSSSRERMDAAGYPFAYNGAWGSAENLGFDATSAQSLDVTQYTINLHEALFQSSGHRKNILHPFMADLGLGLENDWFFYQDNWWNTVMVTQNFAYSDNSFYSYITGVVYTDADGDNFYDPGEGVGEVTVTPATGQYYGKTSASGGYAFPYNGWSGTLQVTFSGGPLLSPVTREVQMDGWSRKLDLNLAELTGVKIVPGSFSCCPVNGFQAQVVGYPGTQFRLMHSTDLSGWEPVGTYTLTSTEPLPISHIPPGEAPANSFYQLEIVQ